MEMGSWATDPSVVQVFSLYILELLLVICMSFRFDSAVAVCLIYALYSTKIVSLDCRSQHFSLVLATVYMF